MWPAHYVLLAIRAPPVCTVNASGLGIFAPNAVGGSLTLPMVKFTNVVSNVLVGRGLAVFVGLVAYRACTDVLHRLTEIVPVSHELYAALAFSGQSLSTLPSLFKA